MKHILLLVISTLLIFSPAKAYVREKVNLQVPIVKQGKMLCGPATVEMIFRYWGVDRYNQYDIARALMVQFADTARYRDSTILETDPPDWGRYPGTGTISMREFLKRFGKTENMRLKDVSGSAEQIRIKGMEFLRTVQEYVSTGIPVIVHQYWKLPKSRGHYRVVTGYDDIKEVVYLNDAHGGRRVVQSYDTFLKLWNVDEKWLHFNAIVFNIEKRKVEVNL